MGRAAYLTRLGLGRSAFESGDTSEVTSLQHDNGGAVPGSATAYDQIYNSKGQPVNSATILHNEAQIRAKNEILEAVGICERRNEAASQAVGDDEIVKLSVDEWTAIDKCEDDLSCDAHINLNYIHLASTWWFVTLRRRLQVGVTSSRPSFIEIIAREWTQATTQGFFYGLRHFSAGAASEALTIKALEWAKDFIGEGFAEIKYRIRHSSLSRRRRKKLWRHAKHANHLSMVFFKLMISPLPLFSCLQQLGLYDSRLGIPPLTSFLPWHESSPLQWAWSSGSENSSFLTRLSTFSTSPVSLWLLLHALGVWTDRYGNIFIPADPNDQTPVLGPPYPYPHVPSAPWYLHHLVTGRDRLLTALSWSPQSHPETLDFLAARSAAATATAAAATTSISTTDPAARAGAAAAPETAPDRTGKPRSYRLTLLSRLASNIIEARLHALFWDLALLPLESLLLRAVAASYLDSAFARSSSGSSGINPLVLARARGLYSPLGGGPFGRAMFGGALSKGGIAEAGGGWKGVGDYASKVGLCFLSQTAVDCVIWGGAWAAIRWVGIRRFYWGLT